MSEPSFLSRSRDDNSSEPSESSDLSFKTHYLLPHERPALAQLYQASIQDFAKLTPEELADGFARFLRFNKIDTQFHLNLAPDLTVQDPSDPESDSEGEDSKKDPKNRSRGQSSPKVSTNDYFCRLSEYLSHSLVSSSFYDVYDTRKNSLKGVIPVIKANPMGHVQRVIFFKLFFSARVTPKDLEGYPMDHINIMAQSLSMFYGRPVDFSTPEKVIRDCEELGQWVRPLQTSEHRVSFLLGRFFGSLLLGSRLPSADFIKYCYHRYFQLGFSTAEMQQFFEMKVLENDPTHGIKPEAPSATGTSSKVTQIQETPVPPEQKSVLTGGNAQTRPQARPLPNRCLQLKVFKVNGDLFQRLARCRRLVTEFSAFADCDLDRLLVEEIRENFLKMLVPFVAMIDPSAILQTKVHEAIKHRSLSHRRFFPFTIREQQQAVQWLLLNIKNSSSSLPLNVPVSSA